MAQPDNVGAEPVPAEDRLDYRGEVFINFRNHTYQWVSIKLFALPAEAVTMRFWRH